MTDTTASTQDNRKPLVGRRTGTVVSDKRDQTRKVEVSYQARDAKYGKMVKKRSMFHVHDPANQSRQGDVVEIAPCRPVSKTKSWRLVRVVEQAPEQIHH